MARDLSFLEQRVADRATEKREQRESDPDSYAKDLAAPSQSKAPVMSAASLKAPTSGSDLRNRPIEETGKEIKRVATALSKAELEAKNLEALRRRQADRAFIVEQNAAEDTHENLQLLQNIFKEQTNKIVKTLKSQHAELMKAVGNGTGQGGLIGGLLDLFGLGGGKDKGKGGKGGAGGKGTTAPGKAGIPSGKPTTTPGAGVPKGPTKLAQLGTKTMDAGRSLFSSAKNVAGSAAQGLKNFGSRTAVALEAGSGPMSKLPELGRQAIQSSKSAATTVANTGSSLLQGAKSAGSSLLKSGANALGAINSSASAALPRVADAASSALGQIKSVGAKAVTPLIEGARGLSSSGVLGAVSRTAGAAVAPALGAYEAYTVIKDDTKTDSQKAQGVANAAGGVAGASAGGTLGAAMGTAILPGYGTLAGGLLGGVAGYFGGEKLVDSIGTSITSSIVDSSAGEILGRGAALAMAPFSEDARRALKTDLDTSVEGMRSAVQPLADSTNSLKDSMKDYLDGLKTAGVQLGSSVYSAAAAIANGARAAAAQVVQTGREKGVAAAVASIPEAAKKAGAPAVAKAASELNTGAAAAKQTMADVRTRQTSNTKGIAAGRWNESEAAAIKAGEASGEKFRSGTGLTQETKDKITKAGEKYGIDPQHLMTMAQMESGGNTNAVSPTGASGLFQFTGGTAKQYGLKNRFDADENIDAAARLYADNKKSLERNGIEPTLDNLYLAHQQGAGGAAQILKSAQTGAPLSEQVKTNIGLNVGGNAGSVQGFIDANKKALASAGKRAKETAAPDTYAKAGTAPAKTPTTETAAAASAKTPTAASQSGRSNAQLLDYQRQVAASEVPAGTVPGTAAQALSPQQTASLQLPAVPDAQVQKFSTPPGQSSVSQSHVPMSTASPANMSVAASAMPQPLVGPQTPVEVPQVRMADSGASSASQAQMTRSTDTKTRGGSSQPTLDEVPMQISDLGLVLLNIGHV